MVYNLGGVPLWPGSGQMAAACSIMFNWRNRTNAGVGPWGGATAGAIRWSVRAYRGAGARTVEKEVQVWQASPNQLKNQAGGVNTGWHAELLRRHGTMWGEGGRRRRA